MNKDQEHYDDPANLSSINLDSINDHYHGDGDSYIEGATPSALQPGGDDSPEASPKARSPSGDLAKRNNVINQDNKNENFKDQRALSLQFHQQRMQNDNGSSRNKNIDKSAANTTTSRIIEENSVA